MNASLHPSLRLVWAGLFFILLLLTPVSAYPPAPHQTVFGMVRDEQGNPLNATQATVFVEIGGKVVAQTSIGTKLDLGVNYRLTIPLDAGAIAEKYKPNALFPAVPFRLRVRIANRSYLPIEMSGASSLITEPGGSSRVDLTLGEDSDGDGIPDAWERALIAAIGGNKTLADIRPGDDADGDGLSNLNEYLAGTYAFDPKDGFVLAIRSVEAGKPLLEFTVIRGRTYTIHGSADLESWTQLSFSLTTDNATVAPRTSYISTDVRPIRATIAPLSDGESAPRFFRLMVH